MIIPCKIRIRQMIIYGDYIETNEKDEFNELKNKNNIKLLIDKRLKDTSLKLFKNLIQRCLIPNQEILLHDLNDDNQNNNALQSQLVALMNMNNNNNADNNNETNELSELQKMVFNLTINEIK